MVSDRHYPGKPRFTTIKTIVKVHARAEYPDRCIFDTRYFISSAARNIDRIAAAVRANKSKGVTPKPSATRSERA
jgi:hypothetical protein